MMIQIINYGAFIRLVMDSNVFLLSKAQIKNVEVIRDDTVRINYGEGPLQEILIPLSDVTHPAGLVDVAALRDTIAHMLDNANQFELEALQKMQTQVDELVAIKQLFNLWNSSLQIDMNYQQLQVNALVAINDKLLKEAEDNQKIIDSLKEQEVELKGQGQQLAMANARLSDIKSLQELLVNTENGQSDKLSQQAAILSDHGAALTSMNSTLTLIAVSLTEMKGLLEDIKSNTTPNP